MITNKKLVNETIEKIPSGKIFTSKEIATQIKNHWSGILPSNVGSMLKERNDVLKNDKYTWVKL